MSDQIDVAVPNTAAAQKTRKKSTRKIAAEAEPRQKIGYAISYRNYQRLLVAAAIRGKDVSRLLDDIIEKSLSGVAFYENSPRHNTESAEATLSN